MSYILQTIENDQDEMKMDTKDLQGKLDFLKKINLKDAVVNLYLTKVSPVNKLKRFQSVKKLKIHDDDKSDFANFVIKCIDSKNHISELRTITTNQDNRFFYVEKSSTDFGQFEELLKKEIEFIKKEDEIHEFNSYVIKVTTSDSEENLYAFNFIGDSWSVKKSNNKFMGLESFKNELIVKIEKMPRFEISENIDFIQINEDLFISNLSKFEMAMNFRQRLLEKKDAAIEDMVASSTIIIEEKDRLVKAVGSDKHLMRQLASVYEKGFYKNDIWLTKLKAAAVEAGNWRIKFHDNGSIIIEEDKIYIKELLTLLQNKRVKTVVDGEIFDVDGELVALN